MSKSGIVIPREHGGWAMLIVPYLIGMMTGQPGWIHIPLFFAWFFLYLSSYPFLQALKKTKKRQEWLKWGMIYISIAIICLTPTLIAFPKLLYMTPLLLALLAVNMWHAKKKSERALVNDLSAILIFCLGGAASYWVGGGAWDYAMFVLVVLNFVYFSGTVFFVKSVFRERTNKRWVTISKIYHVVQLVIPWMLWSPLMIVPYLFSTFRAFVYGGKLIRPMKVGIIEIISSVIFLVLTLIWF